MPDTKYPTVPKNMDETVVVQTRNDLLDELEPYEAQAISELLVERAQNRTDTRYDAVVVVKKWATQDRYDIAETPVLFAAEIGDYSAKAIRCRGGFWVDTEAVVDYKWMSNVLIEAEADYDATYVPKKAVKTIIRPEL